MADLYGSHFEYAGKASRYYGLIIANVETDRNIQLTGVYKKISVFNKKNNRDYLIGDDYSDSLLSFDVEIVTDDESCLDKYQRREIEKWLFRNKKYERFYIDMSDDADAETYEYIDGQCKRLYLNCRFTNPTRLEYNGGVVGYKVTLEADSNMWWQESITKTIEIENPKSTSNSMITIDTDTDDSNYIYPKVTIHTGDEGGDVFISNYSDDSTRLTQFLSLSANTYFILNGETNYISGQNYEKFYKQNFPRLVDGKNYIYISGNVVKITFEFSNRRFL